MPSECHDNRECSASWSRRGSRISRRLSSIKVYSKEVSLSGCLSHSCSHTQILGRHESYSIGSRVIALGYVVTIRMTRFRLSARTEPEIPRKVLWLFLLLCRSSCFPPRWIHSLFDTGHENRKWWQRPVKAKVENKESLLRNQRPSDLLLAAAISRLAMLKIRRKLCTNYFKCIKTTHEYNGTRGDLSTQSSISQHTYLDHGDESTRPSGYPIKEQP